MHIRVFIIGLVSIIILFFLVSFVSAFDEIETSVNQIIPYEVNSSPITITCNGPDELENISLWYRWSNDNQTWSTTSFGDITDNIGTNYNYEWDTDTGRYMDAIRLGSSEYYLIAYQGASSDGFLRTIHVWNDNGAIQQSLIDSWEHDTSDGGYDSISHIAGDVYAIAYRDGTTKMKVFTVNVDDSNGDITNLAIDTLSLSYVGYECKIVQVKDNIYAVAYRDTSYDGWIETISIDSSGNIGNSIIDRIEFDKANGYYPKMTMIDNDTIAIVYQGTNTDGFLVTYNISSTGDITNTCADLWEFDTNNGGTPNIIKINNNIFAIAYEGTDTDGFIKTLTITNTGMITKSWIDTLEFNTADAGYQYIFHVSYNVYGIAYQGTSADGFICTLYIDDDGIISDTIIDSLEFDNSDNLWYATVIPVSNDYFLIVYQDYGNDGMSHTIEIDTDAGWIYWVDPSNPDTNIPWSWDFNFPCGNSFYEFYSIGKKSGTTDELLPNTADANCFYNHTGNLSPIIQSPDPTNGRVNVSIDLTVLNVEIIDFEGDTFNWTIETSPNIGSNFFNYDVNGIKNCPIESLCCGTTYTWFVNATDIGSNLWTNKTYIFTVQDNPPIVILNSPVNNASINGSQITFNCTSIDDAGLHNISLYYGSNDFISGDISIRVSTGSDDSEEVIRTGANYPTSTDLELGYDSSYSGAQIVATRFNGVQIPQGANIISAYVEFECDVGTWTGSVPLQITGQDIDNAPKFTSTAYDISSRTDTTAVVLWTITTQWLVNSKYQSTDISSIVQEIVDRQGWNSGNSMVIMFTGSGTNRREAESYEGELTAAPLLVVEYTTGGSPAWHEEETKTIAGTTNITTFLLNLDPGSYKWNCKAYDFAGNYAFASSNYTFTVLPPQYILTTNVIGNGTIIPTSGSVYTFGTVVNVEAQPSFGWLFESWGGDLNGTDNTTTILMDNNKTITATFSTIPLVGWTAYNDLAGAASTSNITNYHSGDKGYLKDFDTGTVLNVNVSITGGTNNGTGPGILPPGTDAYDIFYGKINLDNYILDYSGGNHVFTFTGLDQNKTYCFIHWADRAEPSYDNIYNSTVIISDVDSFNKNSSIGVTHSQTTITDDSASYCTGYNSIRGFVAGFTDINPGSDGDITITVTDINGKWYSGAFMLKEIVPVQMNFTIIVLPDTQYYSASYPNIYTNQTQWIVANKDALKIVYVGHEGDIVDTATSTTQWNNANISMSFLENPITTGLPDGIPYSVIRGNHDVGTLYDQYFSISRFQGRSYYGGNYNNNQNNYVLFNIGNLKFIIVGLDYDPDSYEIEWANNIINTYSDRKAIVLSHSMLLADASWTTPGLNIYNGLKANPNVFLMLCGHTLGESRRTDVYNGNTIYTILADYQGYTNGGNGFLRIMEFCPTTNEIKVKTYSPYLNQYETDANSQFTLSYTMS